MKADLMRDKLGYMSARDKTLRARNRIRAMTRKQYVCVDSLTKELRAVLDPR